ncbi:unnamed protein product [Brassicogethes aeneus]|uniref:Proteasome assembly chaperone 2 n=1 Tax=Brassicogethes aeneus TaxID=1431903 RepID=A0A9P0FC52_BRAAE|nr:unnamed protein product [Brassicogethes aeneus]
MTNFFKSSEPLDLNEHTLIIPGVSVGNVPQFSVDLLITTFDLKKVATIWHPGIVSSVGNDPFTPDSTEICTACELYSNKESKISAIQLRSTLEFKLVKNFIEDLKSALGGFKLKKIVILASGFDYELHTVSSNKFFYVSNDGVDKLMKDNGVKALENDANEKYYIHGDGFGCILFSILSEKFKTTILVKYVSEGDNIPDAFSMFEKLCRIIDLKFSMESIQIPYSWKNVFGGPPPLGIF